MSSILLAQILCDVDGPGCAGGYPSEPVAYRVDSRMRRDLTDLRAEAADEGWEVRRGRYGRDACPACRSREVTGA